MRQCYRVFRLSHQTLSLFVYSSKRSYQVTNLGINLLHSIRNPRSSFNYKSIYLSKNLSKNRVKNWDNAIVPSDYSIQLFLSLFIHRKGVTKLLIWELTLWRKETILGRHLIINLSIYIRIYLKIDTNAIALFSFLRKELQTLLQWSAFSSSFSFSSKKKLASNSKKGTPQRDPPLRKRN